MEINLEALGLNTETLQERLIDALCQRVLTESFEYEDGERAFASSKLEQKLKAAINKRIDDGLAAVCEKHILPNAAQYIEAVTIQKTNEYGEKRGAPLTFIEYLTKRADDYLQEPVNMSGKTKTEDSYSWRQHSTRISYLIHQHLHFSIEAAMKGAVKSANDSIIGGLEKAVKVALAEVAGKLKVEVKV